MARRLATVRRVDAVTPIPGADRIECAHVGGWTVVVGRGEFHAGDLAVYFEPDSMLPVGLNPVFAKAADYGKRKRNPAGEDCVVLRTVRLRGQASQGLLATPESLGLHDVRVDEDVSDALHVVKWDPPEVMPAHGTSVRPANLLPWPSALPVWKTDEERVQNLVDEIGFLLGCGDPAGVLGMFRASEKADGTSTTYVTHRTEDGVWEDMVCSRNSRVLDDGSDNPWWGNYRAYGMHGLLESLRESLGARACVALQGESVGPGINSNRLRLGSRRFLAFNLLVDGNRIDPHGVRLLDGLCVPALGLRIPWEPGMDGRAVVDALVGQADGLESRVTPGRLMEGVVWRCDSPRLETLPGWAEASRAGSRVWQSHFKVLDNEYLSRL